MYCFVSELVPKLIPGLKSTFNEDSLIGALKQDFKVLKYLSYSFFLYYPQQARKVSRRLENAYFF